jgi:hypothetical protein
MNLLCALPRVFGIRLPSLSPLSLACVKEKKLLRLLLLLDTRLFLARVRDNGDTRSRRIIQENGRTGRRSRLKIQAGCRPCRHTLPDPNDVDALWSKNSAAVSAPNISAPRADGWDALR